MCLYWTHWWKSHVLKRCYINKVIITVHSASAEKVNVSSAPLRGWPAASCPPSASCVMADWEALQLNCTKFATEATAAALAHYTQHRLTEPCSRRPTFRSADTPRPPVKPWTETCELQRCKTDSLKAQTRWKQLRGVKTKTISWKMLKQVQVIIFSKFVIYSGRNLQRKCASNSAYNSPVAYGHIVTLILPLPLSCWSLM